MSKQQGPSVRAAHLKDDLWAIDQAVRTAARVRARLSAETIAAIEQALRTDHLPAALNAELAEAVFAECGEQGTRRWATSSFLHSLDGFFKPLFMGLTGLLGPSPGMLFKAFPQGWATIYRDCGRFEVSHPAPGQTRLTWRGVPLVPSDKLPIEDGKTKIVLLRVGEKRQGVVGLFQPGLPWGGPHVGR